MQERIHFGTIQMSEGYHPENPEDNAEKEKELTFRQKFAIFVCLKNIGLINRYEELASITPRASSEEIKNWTMVGEMTIKQVVGQFLSSAQLEIDPEMLDQHMGKASDRELVDWFRAGLRLNDQKKKKGVGIELNGDHPAGKTAALKTQ